VLSRCRGSSVGIVTKLRAGLSRNRSILGGGSGRQRQAAVAANPQAVNAVRIPTERIFCCLREPWCLISVPLLCCLLVALTGRSAISRAKDRHLRVPDGHVAQVGQGVLERSCGR
jgi:hypothetical protein